MEITGINWKYGTISTVVVKRSMEVAHPLFLKCNAESKHKNLEPNHGNSTQINKLSLYLLTICKVLGL